MPGLPFDNTKVLIKDLFSTKKLHDSFEQTALEVFYYQYAHNKTYRHFCDLLGRTKPTHLLEIPFLPVETFKSHKLICGDASGKLQFTSSGTTGMQVSTHHVVSPEMYEESFLQGFRIFYGEPQDYCILALLPSYLERQGSSLIYMAERLISESQHPKSGFFLHNHDELEQVLTQLEEKGQKTLLIGVSFALLDFAEKRNFKLQHTTIMETGGMKGKRKELPREELHEILKNAFGVASIHSEYGMTELLSQAYSKGQGLFETPPWMKVLIRETNDPFAFVENGIGGGINIIDLANVYSCSFLQTQDLGKCHNNHLFEVSGRFDNSDIRGCNLLIAE